MDERFEECEAGVTADELASWQDEYGVSIPAAFAAHLLQYNGGSFDLDTVVVTDEDEWSIERMLSIVHGKPNRVEDVLSADYRPPGFFPVARGLGATEFCLRLQDGAVFYIAYDGTTDEPVLVASSFAAFVQAITTEDEDDDWM